MVLRMTEGAAARSSGDDRGRPPVIGRAIPYAFAAGAAAGIISRDALLMVAAILAVYPHAHMIFRYRRDMPDYLRYNTQNNRRNKT